ncbi:Fic family protein [Leucobacter komagatae]|uniref:Fic family protein n=1 Tax=Leucobacter komagatae TaxID=55969 RepID=UPI000A9AAA2D|nr:Fic family protein [Leucobacter komagatae]
MQADNSGVRSEESADFDVPVPIHGERVVPWKSKGRAKTREERGLSWITVSLPPMIGDLKVHLLPTIAAESERAVAAIAKLNSTHGKHLVPLVGLLLRTESVASSKIEEVEASLKDFALAAHGTKSNASAVSMVASAKALSSLITSVDDGQEITIDNILTAHRLLMDHDPAEFHYKGRLRTEQNWIEGSDNTPLGATFVPPPHDTVPAYIDDLLVFANRDDVPVIAQAAIAHAQFESIHPFTDGNGRIGRALINTVLRRRGVTSSVVVPLASALVAKKAEYFSLLAAYREGDAGPIVRAFCKAAETASEESQRTAAELARLPEDWDRAYEDYTGRRPRAGSAAQRILAQLPATPFFSAEEMEDTIRASSSAVHAALKKFEEAGIIRPLNGKKRDRVWAATAIIDALEELGARVARETRADIFWPTLSSRTAELLFKMQRDRKMNLVNAWDSIVNPEAFPKAILAMPTIKPPSSYLPTIHIPEFVRSQLPTFNLPENMQEAVSAYLKTDVFEQVFRANAAQSAALSRSFAQLAEFAVASTRSTRVPDAVLKALETSMDHDDNPGLEDGPDE